MRLRNIVLVQTSYPPLVSASTSLAWRVTGDHTLRLGVVIIALLNTCALAVAAFALVEAGRHFAHRLVPIDQEAVADALPRRWNASWHGFHCCHWWWASSSPCLLVFVAFGITEPFMTNGYADPIWSLAARRRGRLRAPIAEESGQPGRDADPGAGGGHVKGRGLRHRLALIALIALRGLVTMSAEDRHRHWWRPIAHRPGRTGRHRRLACAHADHSRPGRVHVRTRRFMTCPAGPEPPLTG